MDLVAADVARRPVGAEGAVVVRPDEHVLRLPLQRGRGEAQLLEAVQGRAKKFLLSSVTHVPSGLMGCALAALSSWVA